MAHPRALFLAGFMASVLTLVAALYLEHGAGLEPCPLCILQRLAVLLVGILFLVAGVHGPGPLGRRIYAALAFFTCLLGGAIAGRQIWLQTRAADAGQTPACLPGLDHLLQTLPLRQVFRLVLNESTDCVAVNWTLAGMTIPEWSLLAFIGLGVLALFQLLRYNSSRTELND